MHTLMYVDETGWTGPNIGDPNQPVVMYCGLVLPHHNRAALEQSLQALIGQYPKALPKEPKGSDLLKSHRQFALQLMRCCVDHFGTFLCSGVEKLYQAACMIPHFVHDGEWQPLVRATAIDASMEVAQGKRPRPDGWIDPPKLASAYYVRLKRSPEVLKTWYESVWPDPVTGKGNIDRVSNALNLLKGVLNQGTVGGLTLRELLSTPEIAASQADAADRELTQRLGRRPFVNDLLDSYEKSADLMPDKHAYESGVVAFGNLIFSVSSWLEDLSTIFSMTGPKVDLASVYTTEVVQDEPAISGSTDYKQLYVEKADFLHTLTDTHWKVSHDFAKSHETPGIIAVDVWAAVANALWTAAQSGHEHKWENFSRVVFRRGFSWTNMVAPSEKLEKWQKFIEACWSSSA